MASLSKRVDKLEDAVTMHLQESGEIRADIKWLKKAVWFVAGSPLIAEAVRHLWH